MEPNTLFVTITWDNQRYYVPQKHWNAQYFLIVPNIFLQMVGHTRGTPAQIVVKLTECELIPEGVKVVRLGSPLRTKPLPKTY